MQFEELAHSSNEALEQIFSAAAAPSPQALVGYEWRGYNMTPIARLLGIQKFIKGFFASEGHVEGYNIKTRQNDLSDAWIHQPSAEHPRRYAFFTVSNVEEKLQNNLYRQLLFLNYGASPRNPRFAVARILRDYVVQPDPANPDLFLGKAYTVLGSFRSFSNFFVIERLQAVDWTP